MTVVVHVHKVMLLLFSAFMVCGMANRADDITAHPNDVTVREGDAAEFSCTASRSPDEHVSPLLIVWKLNNSLVDPERPYVGTELHLSDGGSVATGILRIKQTDRSRDFGLYRCTVISSSLPVDSKPAHLTFVKGELCDCMADIAQRRMWCCYTCATRVGIIRRAAPVEVKDVVAWK